MVLKGEIAYGPFVPFNAFNLSVDHSCPGTALAYKSMSLQYFAMVAQTLLWLGPCLAALCLVFS